MFAEKLTRLPTHNERHRKQKDTNERRKAIENDLRAFDDEDAFASPMDRGHYEKEYSSLLLEGEKTEEETQVGSCYTLLPAKLELSGRMNGL